MELRVEVADGCKMPPGSFVAVKLGDALKQGRYEPKRAYQFPEALKRRHAKIDVFKHVGTSAVLVNPDAGTRISEVSIASSDPAVEDLRLKVNMKPSAAAANHNPAALAPAAKTAQRSLAQAYLEKHGLELKLSTCMKELLQIKPEDPLAFVCSYLQGVPYPPDSTGGSGDNVEELAASVHSSEVANVVTCGCCGARLRPDGKPLDEGALVERKEAKGANDGKAEQAESMQNDEQKKVKDVKESKDAEIQTLSPEELFRMEVCDVRDATRQTLLEAVESGELHRSLDSCSFGASQETRVEQAPVSPLSGKRLESGLQRSLRDRIHFAAMDGQLSALLDKVPSGPVPAVNAFPRADDEDGGGSMRVEAEDFRENTRNALESATKDGRLLEILNEQSPPPTKAGWRKQDVQRILGDKLLETSSDGKLLTLLHARGPQLDPDADEEIEPVEIVPIRKVSLVIEDALKASVSAAITNVLEATSEVTLEDVNATSYYVGLIARSLDRSTKKSYSSHHQEAEELA